MDMLLPLEPSVLWQYQVQKERLYTVLGSAKLSGKKTLKGIHFFAKVGQIPEKEI